MLEMETSKSLRLDDMDIRITIKISLQIHLYGWKKDNG